MSAYCCTGGQTMPAAISTGATKSGGLVRTSSGGRSSSSVSTPPSRAQARASDPATTTVPARPVATSASAWLITSCWETPISQRSVRAPGDPTRRATVRAGSVSDHVPCGTAMQSMRPSSPGAPASAAAADTASVIRSTTGAASVGGAEPDQDREARVEGAHGSGHDARCYGPAMAHGEAGRWEAELEDFTKESFEADGKRRDVFRIGSGPAVIVISEIPGITPLVAQFGRRVAAAGCTAVLPVLFGDPGRPAGAAYMFQSIGPACVSREFSAFALKKTSPVTVWLRKLAAAEHERCGGPGVGVVGMCFTGGFALAMMVDDIVLAPVLSQPSLPFPLSKKFKADIGISDGDLARVKERTATGTCLLGLRFTNDPFCFEERFETLRRELGDAFIAVEIDSAPGNPHGHPKKAHSVLTEHLTDEEGTPTRAALDQTLTFFREKLGVGSGPGPRPDGLAP